MPNKMLQHKFNPQPFLGQLFDLTLIQLSNWRWSWRGMVTTGILTPLFAMIALSLFVGGSSVASSSQEALIYIFTGNIVLALMFENQDKVGSNFAFMKAMGTLNYFAMLPIRRSTLILATVLAFSLLSLPALFVTITLGALYLRIPVHLHPLLVIVLPLAAAPLAGLGALIGCRARTPEESGSLNLIATWIMLGLGPVILPPSRLPAIVLKLSWLSPATYAASALRQTLIGPLTWRLALDTGMLLVLSLVMLGLVGRWMDWRKAA